MKTQSKWVLWGLAAVMAMLLPGAWMATSAASHGAGDCGAPAPCGPQLTYVEKLIYVPTWFTEKRTVTETHYKTETRPYKYTVYQCVPEKRTGEEVYTVLKPVTKKRTVKYTEYVPHTRKVTQDYQVHVPVWREVTKKYHVQVPVWKDVEKTYTVLVPHQEEHKGERTICEMVPTVETRTITRDCGYWATQIVQVPCGGCGCCGGCCVTTVCKKVWVPKVVHEQVKVTVYRPKYTKQPYTYTVTVCRPEQRKQIVKVCSYETQERQAKYKVCEYKTETKQCTYNVVEYKPQEKSREETYVVCVPETHKRQYTYTVYKTVAVEKTGTQHVCVPHQVQKEVDVKVCRMVAKKVTVPVCVTCCVVAPCCH